jgi:hypothetical protein
MITEAQWSAFCDAEWFRSWAGSHYDTRTREVVLIGDPPAYVIAHEQAHAAQHAELTRLYRAWRRTHWVPIVGRFFRLLLEFDADDRARAKLISCGQWDAQNQRAARLVMYSYGLPSTPLNVKL